MESISEAVRLHPQVFQFEGLLAKLVNETRPASLKRLAGFKALLLAEFDIHSSNLTAWLVGV